MKVQVEEISPIERKLSIEVEPQRVTEELERAYSTLGRQVKVAGFRPGKVPRRILEQRFKEQVEDDVIHRVVERAYVEAIREHKVEAVSSPTVSNPRLKLDEPFKFEARVEVRPKIEVKDYTGLPLPKAQVKIDEAKVTERLEELRNRLGRLEPVNGRDVAAAKDFVQIDFDATIDGKPFPGSRAENITVEVAPGELVESNVAALEGVKVGETKAIDYVFPADYRVEEIRGKTAKFQLTVKGLKVQVTPELNDELAKELQAGETLEDLKKKIREDLERGEKNRIEGEEREALYKVLIERNAFEVPGAMVERAVDAMLEGALRNMARGGIDVRNLQLDFEKLREDMRPRALTEVKGALLLEAIAEKEKLSPSDEEVEARIAKLAEESQQPLSQIRKHFKGPDERRGLFLRLREEKAIEFLKSRATYS
jgi:trigger factor